MDGNLLLLVACYCVSSAILYGIAGLRAMGGRKVMERSEFLSWIYQHKFYLIYCLPWLLLGNSIAAKWPQFQVTKQVVVEDEEYSARYWSIPYDGPLPAKGILHHASYWQSILTGEYKRTLRH